MWAGDPKYGPSAAGRRRPGVRPAVVAAVRQFRVQQWALRTPRPPPPPQRHRHPHAQRCPTFLDIVILLDGSNSIYPWHEVQRFLRAAAGGFFVGPQQSQVAVLQYGGTLGSVGSIWGLWGAQVAVLQYGGTLGSVGSIWGPWGPFGVRRWRCCSTGVHLGSMGSIWDLWGAQVAVLQYGGPFGSMGSIWDLWGAQVAVLRTGVHLVHVGSIWGLWGAQVAVLQYGGPFGVHVGSIWVYGCAGGGA
eukprot:XP_024999208.1 uncharacterized protein LOC112530281 [Gallus gallus]